MVIAEHVLQRKGIICTGCFILKCVSCENAVKIICFSLHIDAHVCDILMLIPRSVMVRLKYLFTSDY